MQTKASKIMLQRLQNPSTLKESIFRWVPVVQKLSLLYSGHEFWKKAKSMFSKDLVLLDRGLKRFKSTLNSQRL